MYKMGPFYAETRIDEENCLYVDIFHVYDEKQILASIDVNICLEDSGYFGIPSQIERDTLCSWLVAGDQNIISDLRKAGFKEPEKEYHLMGYTLVKKIVRSGNSSSARINLPPSWQGCHVSIIAHDPVPDEDIEE